MLADDGGLAGPFNAYLYAPEVGARLAELGGVLLSKSSVPRRILELMVVTVGAHWKAEYEWYAHSQMAREHGVPDSVISAIGAGEEPQFDSDDDALMYRLARVLVATGRIPDDLYQAAEQVVGHRGLVEVISLCGFYTLISFLLNGFEVPVPADELQMWPTRAETP